MTRSLTAGSEVAPNCAMGVVPTLKLGTIAMSCNKLPVWIFQSTINGSVANSEGSHRRAPGTAICQRVVTLVRSSPYSTMALLGAGLKVLKVPERLVHFAKQSKATGFDPL